VVIFNFRADRVLELSRAFEYDKFDKFNRKRHPKARVRRRACARASPRASAPPPRRRRRPRAARCASRG